MSITLTKMTRELCHQLYQDWENDEAVYLDMTKYHQYQYSAESVDRHFEAKQRPDRIYFAILYDGVPVGELYLKQINLEKKTCTLSIHLQNDSVKGRGYGTVAEQLAIEYAFDKLGMDAVYADAVLKNRRSQHVLEKVGFRLVDTDEQFKYYRIDRDCSVDE